MSNMLLSVIPLDSSRMLITMPPAVRVPWSPYLQTLAGTPPGIPGLQHLPAVIPVAAAALHPGPPHNDCPAGTSTAGKSGHQYCRSTNNGIPRRLIVGREIQELGIAWALHLGGCLFLFTTKTAEMLSFYPDK